MPGEFNRNKTPYLSIIVPAFNEAERLPETLKRIVTFIKAQNFITELIVVDNASSDTEKDIVMEFCSRYPFVKCLHEAIRCKGAAVRQRAQKAMTSPFTDTSWAVFSILLSGCCSSRLYDTQCGFKCFRRDVEHELFSAGRIDGWSFDVEILYLARLKGSPRAHIERCIVSLLFIPSQLVDNLPYIIRKQRLAFLLNNQIPASSHFDSFF